MSDREVVSTLVGKLVWEVDNRKLTAFQRALQNIAKTMTAVSAQATKLQNALNLKLKVADNGGLAKVSKEVTKLQSQLSRKLRLRMTNPEQAKLAKELERSQTAGLRREALLQRARKATFAAELQQSKLVATGKREDTFLATAAVRHQQQLAVLASKQASAEQASLKAQGVAQRNQQSLLAAKTRQMRLEQLVQQTAIKTQTLQARHAQTLTRTQRAELSLIQAREAGERKSERYSASVAEAKLRAARQAAGADQRASRFRMSEERHAAWQAAQATRAQDAEKGSSFALPLAVSGLGAALFGATKILSYAQHRVDARREQAADTQLFDNQLLAAGNNPDEQAKIRKAYIDNSQEYGQKINKDTAVQYSNQVQGFRAQGKTLDEAIQLQKEQAAVFRIGALNEQQQYSAALQLGQGYGKDRFTGGDLRPLTDALGSRLTNILYKAIGKSLGYKGNQDQLAGFVLQAQHDGLVNGKMVQQGLRDIVAQSPELLERHKHSLDAQMVRIDNDKYLRNDEINQSPELIQALTELNTSERELIAGNATLARAMSSLDVSLAKMETGFFRMLIGKNIDGSVKTPEQIATSVAGVGTTEAAAIDPTAFGGKANSESPIAKDPIDRLYQYLFGKEPQRKADDESTDWSKVQPQSLLPSARPELDRSSLNGFNWGQALTDRLAVNPIAMTNMQDTLNYSNRFTPENMLREAQARNSTPGSPTPMLASVTNTVNAGAVVVNNNFEIHPAEGMDAIALGQHISTVASDAVRSEVRDEIQRTLQYHQKEVE